MLTPTDEALRSAVLRVLGDPRGDPRTNLAHTFPDVLREREHFTNLRDERIKQALWRLLSQGLVYLDFPIGYRNGSQPLSTASLAWRLTEAGEAAVRGEDVNPDDGDTYLRHLRESVTDADALLFRYATEALIAFRFGCYLASAVMLGVASEAAVLETATAFTSWLPTTEGNKLQEVISSRKVFSGKFDEFRKRLQAHRHKLPAELEDGLDAMLVAVGELLRADRNDSGHPTGKRITRERQHGHLTIFVPYVQRLYALRRFFLSRSSV